MSKRTRKGRTSTRASTTQKRKYSEVEINSVTENENIPLQKDTNVEKQQIEEFKKAKLQALLSDFDNEVESRIKEMQLEAESLAQKFKQALFIWLLQLPSQVRKLTLDEFINKYDGDINKVIRGVQQSTIDSVMTPIPDRSELKSTLRANTMQSIKRLQRYLGVNDLSTASNSSQTSFLTPLSGRTFGMISQVEAKSNPSGEIPLPPPPQTTSLSQLQNTATHNTHTINSISLNSLSTTRSEENILNHNQNGAVSNNLLKERVQNKSEDKEMSKDLESMITTKNEQPLESVSRETAERMLLLATRTPSKPTAFGPQKRQESSSLTSSATQVTTKNEDKHRTVDPLKQPADPLQKLLKK